MVTGSTAISVGAVVFFTGYFVAHGGKSRDASSASARSSFILAPAPRGATLALRATF